MVLLVVLASMCVRVFGGGGSWSSFNIKIRAVMPPESFEYKFKSTSALNSDQHLPPLQLIRNPRGTELKHTFLKTSATSPLPWTHPPDVFCYSIFLLLHLTPHSSLTLDFLPHLMSDLFSICSRLPGGQTDRCAALSSPHTHIQSWPHFYMEASEKTLHASLTKIQRDILFDFSGHS